MPVCVGGLLPPPGVAVQRAALRRATAYHLQSNLCLFVQQFRGSGWLLLIWCSFQAAGWMTMSDLPDGLGRQRNSAGNSRRAHAFWRLQKQARQVEGRWPHFRSFF